MERDNLKYTNVVLERIANALEETLRLVKKDMDDSKARITAQWDKELDKKDLPFPEVE
jgi:ribosome biogenesis GTPase A